MAQTASQPAVLLRLIGGPAVCSDRMIQASSKRPGTQAMVARTKNGLHPSVSASAPPEADTSHVREGAGKRVLVIDDEEPILHMVREALTPRGYEVDIASDGESVTAWEQDSVRP